MNRVCNFGAGPCTLPLEVLQEAQAEFLDFQGSGMSIIEASHRGKEYDAVHMEAIQLIKELYSAPSDMEVLFLQGGATLQFSMIPMNILKPGNRAAYIKTGTWANKAASDAKLYGDMYVAWDGKENGYSRMPETRELALEGNTQYLYLCSNETIGGIRFASFPEVNIPIVADMSSDFMSRPIPWEKFDVVYGGVQKNLAPSGMAVVFIRKHLLENLNPNLGAYLSYSTHMSEQSLYNTPPVFSIYIMGKVLKWMKKAGGLSAIESLAIERSSLIYSAIDNSDGYYRSPVNAADRSLMNIVFRLPNEDLEKQFIAEATRAGMIGLKGHRSVGGCRASVYNALPVAAARTLVDFMHTFKIANPASVMAAGAH